MLSKSSFKFVSPKRWKKLRLVFHSSAISFKIVKQIDIDTCNYPVVPTKQFHCILMTTVDLDK